MSELRQYVQVLGKTKVLIFIGIILLATVIPAAAISHFRNQEGSSDYSDGEQGLFEESPEYNEIISDSGKFFESGRVPEVHGEWNYDQEKGLGEGDKNLPDKSEQDDNQQSSSGNQSGSDSTDKENKDNKEDKDNNDDESDKDDGSNPDEDPWVHPWEEIGIDQGINKFFSETSNPMTRRNFAKITGLLYEYYSGEEMVQAFDNTFSDTTDQWILKSYNHGVAPEGEGNRFYPARKITREEGAYILYLLLEVKGERYSARSLWVESEDLNEISRFALEAMTFMDHHVILSRRSADLLDPKKSLTAEEAEKLFINLQRYIKDFDRYADSLERPKNLDAMEEGGTLGLRWDRVDSADYYYMYEASKKDGRYFALRDPDGVPLKIYWRHGEILQVTGLNEGSDYYYRVTAVINGIESNPSEPVKVTGTRDWKGEYRDYEEHLVNNYAAMTIGERELKFSAIELRENSRGELELFYFVNLKNSELIRLIEKDGKREDIRTLFGHILDDLQEEFGKDVTGQIVYRDQGLEKYPDKYQDNLIEADPISKVEKDGKITYSVWFPYLTISIDAETGDYRHKWYMTTQEL